MDEIRLKVENLDTMVNAIVMEALRLNNFNATKAATLLGISRKTIYNRVQPETMRKLRQEQTMLSQRSKIQMQEVLS